MIGFWGGKGGRREAPRIKARATILAEVDSPKRDKQLNLRVSEDCRRVFLGIARLQGLSSAALFEDLVAERAELMEKAGTLKL